MYNRTRNLTPLSKDIDRAVAQPQINSGAVHFQPTAITSHTRHARQSRANTPLPPIGAVSPGSAPTPASHAFGAFENPAEKEAVFVLSAAALEKERALRGFEKLDDLWHVTAVVQPSVHVRTVEEDYKPHYLTRQKTGVLDIDESERSFKRAFLYFNLVFFASCATAVVFTVLPLRNPTLGFAQNWLYWAVWFPCGVWVVAMAFDTFASVLFVELKRSLFWRVFFVLLYVASAEAVLVGTGAAVKFPSPWVIVCPILCNIQFVGLYFTFDVEDRTKEDFRSRYFYFFLICNSFPALFLAYIVFFLIFTQAGQFVQVIMLGFFCGLNISMRFFTMYLARRVNVHCQLIVAFYQEYLSNFTLSLALPNTANTGVFLLTLVINTFPLILYPIRLRYQNDDTSPIAKLLAGRVLSPLYTHIKFDNVKAAQLAAVRESFFRTYLLSGACEVYGALGFIIIFPCLALGPQAPWFPFIQPILADNSQYRALIYVAITMIVSASIFSWAVVYVALTYFARDWRLLARHSIMSNWNEGVYLFFIQLLIYLLAECILGSHFGAVVFFKDAFGLDISYEK